MNPASLNKRGNFRLGLPTPTGSTSLPILSQSVVFTIPGRATVTITYALGRRVAGTYVTTILANNVTDASGNRLVETRFVTFPQTTNFPNPNYVAQITVIRNLTANGPQPYIPLAECIAAARYVGLVQRHSNLVRRLHR